MAFKFNFDVAYQFELASDFDRSFDLLSDVKTALSLHPYLQDLYDLGNGRYRVGMKKVGFESYNFQTIYTCDYTIDRTQGSIVWVPVRNDGNAWVEGKFIVKPNSGGTNVEMHMLSELSVPLPRWIKSAINSIVIRENRKMSEIYIQNLIKAMGGGRLLNVR